MQEVLGLRILKMLLILLLGGKAPDGALPEAMDLGAFGPGGAPVSAEIDIAQLRALVAESPELTELIYEGKAQDSAFKEAAAFVGLAIGAGPARVVEAFSGVRRAAVWLTAFGDHPSKFRILAVFDVGAAAGVLDGLLAGAGRFEGYHKIEYAGATLHGFAMGRGYGVWCAEAKGFVALALDPIAVKRFLLDAADAEPEPAQAEEEGPALEIEVDCRAFLDMLMLAMGRYDRDEFLVASTLLDFPSWRRAGVTFDGERLEAELEMDPRSPLALALRQPAEAPRLMGAIPDDCGMALVAGLEDARVGWEFVRSAVTFAMKVDRPGADLDIAKEIRDEIGIDVGEAVFGNVRAGAFLVPDFKRLRDIEDAGVFVFDVADAGAAENAIEMFVAAVGGDNIDVRAEGGATIWQGRGLGIAIKGTTVILAPGRNSPLGVVVDQLGRGPSDLSRSLREEHPSATAFATLNLAGLGAGGGPEVAALLAGLGRRSVGLSFEDDVLSATMDVAVPEIAKAVFGVVRAEMVRAAHHRCMSGLRRIYIAAYRHASARNGFPTSLDEMREYLRGSTGKCTLSGKPFVYRSELAGKRVRDFPNRAEVVVAHDPVDAHPDGGAVVYLSGRTEWLPNERFAEFVADLDRKAREAREEEPRPEPEPEPVF